MVTRLRRDEGGFSLIELLAAIMIGTVVMAAALGLLNVAVNSRAKTEDRVDALARGRLGMESVSRELRSALCLGDGLPAVRAASATSITFISSIANATTAADPPMQQRTIAFVDDGGGIGRITESTITGTGTVPNVTFTGTAVNEILVDRVAQDGSTPIFSYRGLNAAGTAFEDLPGPFATVADRRRIGQVNVAFRTVPRQRTSDAKVGETMNAQVLLRTDDPTDVDRRPEC